MLRKLAVLFLLLLAIVSLTTAETQSPDPPHIVYLPLVGCNFYTGETPLLISALHYDTYVSGEPDEAFQIYNPLPALVPLAGWKVTSGTRTVVFPQGITLNGNAKLWCARKAVDFRQTFGVSPGCEYGGDSDPAVPDLTGAAPTFTNTGGRVTLTSSNGSYTDVLVYKAGDANAPGWLGLTVNPYKPSTTFGEAGQILYRKLDQRTGLPVPDTDTRADWAQDPADIINGRKAQYPGWELDRFFLVRSVTEPATLKVLLAPDNSFAAMKTLLEGATSSIRFEGYTIENARLGEIIAARARAGVEVEILLEGSPPGGVSDQQLWVVQTIAQAGGHIYYLRSNSNADIHDRYTYQHGKFWVLDGGTALIGSENINAEAFPDDDKADGTFGRRGAYLVTDAPSVVAELTAIMDADIAPGVHRDVWAWEPTDPSLGAPPAGFVPSYDSGGNSYPVQKPTPLIAQGAFTFQLIHSPEQALRDQDSLLGLVNRAGAGDTILVEQLYENLYWGAESSNIAADPNPRLQAYIAAARRGAKVRVLLDAFFDNQDLSSPRSNLRTVEYLTAVAQVEGLDPEARRRNPTVQGIHNKMVLARIGGQGWAVVGSLNGGEVSAKLNREMALLVGSDQAYAYLADVFWSDWNVTP
jgi:cardiolipin synthase A/B